ncbi:dolichyl-phosphate-mannose-protein mannosyltransferase [Clostridiales bacterium oral taxon 876 str. F0540]|nr:dolichyl-phosphate-mannose-protein mannosyltransferase [Clostridiales bacterium oral taxon 876 str. F0540]
MKKIREIKEYIYLTAIVILSAALNFVNLGIEGTANQYYAAGVKSMTMSLKNFFFVAMDPAGFVTIDKPPFGFWIQAISAKIFGFSGWSILLPQALAGVLSTVVLYIIVKKSFGSAAGLISALCLAITPVFVAVSRNNTIDNQLVLVLILSCWALSAAARKGKFKYLVLSMVLIGIGFNIKALQAYMIVPAVYIMYLFAGTISLKKRITHLALGTAILLAVSFSWALIVDSIPASNRPYVGSSGNNTEMGLIIGHNGSERLSLGSLFGGSNNQQGQGRPGGFSQGGPGQGDPGNFGQGGQGVPGNFDNDGQMQGDREHDGSFKDMNLQDGGKGQGAPGMGGGFQGGGPGSSSGLSGTFGNQTQAGITRLFSKNILADQIVWFIPLAFVGFISASVKEKLRIKLDNSKKQALILWFMWLFPEFIYFSFNTGLFHPHYLTMMAPPAAALSGIGIVTMWEMYKEGGWKAWFLPVALLINGLVQLIMLSYFVSSSQKVKILMVLLIALSFVPVLIMIGTKLLKKDSTKINKMLVSLGVAGILVSPLVGSSAAMFYAVDSTNPSAGMELLQAQLASKQNSSEGFMRNNDRGLGFDNISTENLVNFLNNHKVNGKAQIVVSSSNTAENLTINTDLYVASLSGFMANETVMSLDQFKALVKNGEIRYVLAGDSGRGNSNSEIMFWVQQNGKLISYGADSSDGASPNSSEQLYDLSGSVNN